VKVIPDFVFALPVAGYSALNLILNLATTVSLKEKVVYVFKFLKYIFSAT
jgi:hypothetical protein